MTLDELIAALEKVDPATEVENGFENPHSYRGYYDELAFEPAENVTVAHMLQQARSARGATYTGWKGGEFTMDGDTPVWLADEGCTTEEPFTKAELTLMLRAPAERQTSGWHDAGLSVWRLWERYRDARGPLDAANSLVELNNAMANLVTWLPGYNYNTGTVPEEPQ